MKLSLELNNGLLHNLNKILCNIWFNVFIILRNINKMNNFSYIYSYACSGSDKIGVRIKYF